MRLIITGCEYSGKSTLGAELNRWGRARGLHFHLDDHFTVPDASLRSDEERRYAAGAPPAMKERFQRFQIYYHLHLLHVYEDICLVGFHSEEAVYGPRYYYPGRGLPQNYHRQIEKEVPRDTILCLLSAAPEVIRARMRAAPHPHQVVPAADVEAVQAAFEEEFAASWLKRKARLDTSELAVDGMVDALLEQIKGFLPPRDLLLLRSDLS
ncbi:MAG TPA: hypothetical protein VHS99_23725 [Chloroflexota bacterium]|nr:hypothetical protein [Chloroflexota bacterium]